MLPGRINPILASFAPVVRPNSRILDIGAGNGHLAREMADQLQAHVTMVDIARYNRTHLPFAVCDSQALAFERASFDYAVLCFVLHHSENPAMILDEALRVAHQVIVIENDVRGALRRALTRTVDSAPALLYGTPPCHQVYTREEWLQVFSKKCRVRRLKEFNLELGFFHNFSVLLEEEETPVELLSAPVRLPSTLEDDLRA